MHNHILACSPPAGILQHDQSRSMCCSVTYRSVGRYSDQTPCHCFVKVLLFHEGLERRWRGRNRLSSVPVVLPLICMFPSSGCLCFPWSVQQKRDLVLKIAGESPMGWYGSLFFVFFLKVLKPSAITKSPTVSGKQRRTEKTNFFFRLLLVTFGLLLLEHPQLKGRRRQPLVTRIPMGSEPSWLPGLH